MEKRGPEGLNHVDLGRARDAHVQAVLGRGIVPPEGSKVGG